jgi:acyl-CoA thioesterase-1
MASIRGTLVAGGVALTLWGATTGAAPATESVSTTTPLPAAVVTTPLSILTIGDSIMRGFGLASGKAWPYLLASSDQLTLTTEACDGAGVLQVGAYDECGSDYAGIISALPAALDPDIVIIEGSSNDLGIDNADLASATLSEVRTIRAMYPLAEIVGLSSLWGYTDAPSQLTEIDSQVQAAVQSVGGSFYNIGQPMHDHPELMQSSDVHPTAAGQAVIASIIQTAIAPTVAKAQAEQLAAAATTARVTSLVAVGIIQ